MDVCGRAGRGGERAPNDGLRTIERYVLSVMSKKESAKEPQQGIFINLSEPQACAYFRDIVSMSHDSATLHVCRGV